MRVNLNKNLDKDVFRIIKTVVEDYSPKSALNKISAVNFCKLA